MYTFKGPDQSEWVWHLLILCGGESRECFNLHSEGCGNHLRHIASSWFKDNFTVIRLRQDASSETACKLPTRLTDAKANRRAVFSERGRRLAVVSGSKF